VRIGDGEAEGRQSPGYTLEMQRRVCVVVPDFRGRTAAQVHVHRRERGGFVVAFLPYMVTSYGAASCVFIRSEPE
jgi:hypothetical protein